MDKSPDILEKPGLLDKIRKLNKIPLIIVLSAFTLVIASLSFVGFQKRISDQKENIPIDANISLGPAEAPTGFSFDQGSSPDQDIPDDSPKNTPMTFGSQTSVSKVTSSEEVESNLSRIKQELYEEALVADTSIDIEPRETGPRKLLATNSFPSKDRNSSLSQQEKDYGYLSERLKRERSPFELKTGWVIPAVMLTGINSDLPGMIIAQVSKNVFDSRTGKHLLIPQGTKVIGDYSSLIAVGQDRALVVWKKLEFPNGNYMHIENMQGSDKSGYSGFSDQIDNHYIRIFGSSLLLSLVGAGYKTSIPQKSGEGILTPRQIVEAEIGHNFSKVGSEMIKSNMKIKPRLIIRPGYRFNIMVNKTMILEKYGSKNVLLNH